MQTDQTEPLTEEKPNATDSAPSEPDEEAEEEEKEEWVDNGPLKGDLDAQASQVLELAKARFRQMLKETMQEQHVRAAGRKRKRRRRSAAQAINAFADVAGLTVEEQATMQIACLTQGIVDCATRAAAEAPPEERDDDDDGAYRRTSQQPDDARRSARTAELFSATYLATAASRLMDSLTRYKADRNVRHTITYEHLNRHVAAAAAQPQNEPEQAEEPPEKSAATIADIIFSGVRVRKASATDPSPPPTAR